MKKSRYPKFPHVLLPKVNKNGRIRKIIVFNNNGDIIHLKFENVLLETKLGLEVYGLRMTRTASILSCASKKNK